MKTQICSGQAQFESFSKGQAGIHVIFSPANG